MNSNTEQHSQKQLRRRILPLLQITTFVSVSLIFLFSLFNQPVPIVHAGPGELTSVWSSPESDTTTSVAWGDWDGDGDLDLAVGNELDQNRVYSNSDGDLSLAWTSPELDHTTSVAWGDWDGDGDLDLAVGNRNEQNRVYSNSGGSLSLAWTSPELDRTYSVAWGDWDGDGDLDLAVGNRNEQNRVYSNNDGNLGLAWTSPESDDTRSVAWGDWDGDGDLDLAVGSYDGQNRVYSNNGSSLSLVWTSPESEYTTSVAWGNWDGDGDLDLAVGNYLGQNHVYSNSGGSLNLAWTSPESDNTTSVAWGDWDGDGDIDLAVGNELDQNRVYSNSDGDLSLAWTSPESDNTTSVAWGDWDRDGDLDLVIGSWYEQNQVYRNSGDSLSLAWSSPESDNTYSVAWGDWDGDGDLDLAVGSYDDQNRVYSNSGGNLSLAWSSPESDNTRSVAWGDWDRDGDLDLAVGNYLGQNRVYNNNDGNLGLAWTSPESDNTTSVAWGDWDGDGDLDLAVGSYDDQNRVYSNNGGNLSLAWSSPESDNTRSVAWGDWDRDGDLDLAVGNSGDPNRVYHNSDGNLGLVWTSSESDYYTSSVAWGDWDGDGNLDLAVGNWYGQNRVYSNNGGSLSLAWSSPEFEITSSVAWVDWDGDGDLDLAVGNSGYNRVYRNKDGDLSLAWSSPESDVTRSIVWVDWDGDGDLDLAIGNDGQNRVYTNHAADQVGLGNTPVIARLAYPAGAAASPMGTGVVLDGPTIPITYTLHDPEGHRAVSIKGYYSLDGGSTWQPAGQASIFFEGFEQSGHSTYLIATIPLTLTGVPAATFSSSDVGGRLRTQAGAGFYRTGSHAATLDRDPSGVNTINYLDFTLDLSAYSVTNDNIVLDFSFMHHGEEFSPNDRVWVRGSTSDTWVELVNLNNEQGAAGTYVDLTNIAVSDALQQAGQDFSSAFQLRFGQEDNYPADSLTFSDGYTFDDIRLRVAPIVHTYNWDVYASGVFGASDNAVFRLDVYQGSSGVSPIMYAVKSAHTAPFRIRGSQARVLEEGSSLPLSDAIVYRQPAGQTTPYTPYFDAFSQPFHTNPAGYLQGFGEVAIGDNLVALAPITATESYTLYHTSAAVTSTGLLPHTVTAGGVQTLTVSANNPFLLFNLAVSLEWDARADATFLQQLENDLKRASQILFDLSNGQVALGEIRVYHDRQEWQHAHITIQANNNQRPSAILGGIVMTPTNDIGVTGVITNAFLPGQVRMGATWNRFGDPGGTLGEDWPRALAHELGHYLLYMPDNYLGLTETNRLTFVNCAGSAMTNPYTDAASEFLTRTEWDNDPECLSTLAEQYLGRADWETVTQFYPQLNGDEGNINSGPSVLPLAVTQVTFIDPITPTSTIDAPYFSLIDFDNAPAPIPSGQGQGYLLQTNNTPEAADDYLVPLGSPVGDLILARGAEPGDWLCVYDYSQDPLRLGCEDVGMTADSIQLHTLSDWAPQITVTSVSSRTFAITVTNVSESHLNIQLLPLLGAPSEPIPMTLTGSDFVQTVTLENPAFAGYAWVTVPGSSPSREMVVEFMDIEAWDGRMLSWGGRMLSWGGRMLSWGGRMLSWGAPMMSTDGQVSIFALDEVFGEGSDYSLQVLPQPPALPSWLTLVGGSAYQVRSETMSDNATILFRYLGRDVPAGYEGNLNVYYSPDEGQTWERLPTELDTDYNHASAIMAGDGIYALVATIEVAPSFVEGWNTFGYPVQQARPIIDALASIEGMFSTVANYDPNSATPWKTFYPSVNTLFADQVNTLTDLEYTRAYWLYATEATTLYLGPDTGLSHLPTSLTGDIQMPPTTFYGWITPTQNFTPTIGMSITGWIDGRLCGQTTIQEIDGLLAYVLQVSSKNALGDGNQCGELGDTVTFKVGDWIMKHDHAWDNSQAWFLSFKDVKDDNSIYLPIILR